MNEKDSVSSQDIPAVLRALGTLALAAATAVAIRWFISRDKMEKEENLKLQSNQDPIEDGQSTGDDPKGDEETMGNNRKEPEVSEKQGMAAIAFDCFSHGLLKSDPDTSCPNSDYGKEDRECLTDRKRPIVDLPPVSNQLTNVATLKNTSNNSWEMANVSTLGLPAVIVEDTTIDTQNQVFSSRFIQTYDNTSYERSQDLQLDTGISTSNGECTDVINVKYLEGQDQLTGDEDPVPAICSVHKTGEVVLDEDIFNMDICEYNKNFNCDPEVNIANYTKACADDIGDISRSLSDLEGNVKEHLSNNENLMNTPAPDLPESQENIKALLSPPSHEVLTRRLNDKQQIICTINNMEDIVQAGDIIQEAEHTAVVLSSEDTILTDTPYKSENCTLKGNNHVTCSQQASMEHKIYMTSEEILEETNESFKSSSICSIPAIGHVPQEHMTVEEKNRELFSSVDILHNNRNGKHDNQIAGGSPPHMELLHLPECGARDEITMKTTMYYHTNHVLQWNTTTVYKSTEHIDPMYPLNINETGNSIAPLQEKDGGQSSIDNNVLLSTEKLMSLCKEKEYCDVEADVDSSKSDSVKPVPSTMTRNLLCGPSTHSTFSSTMVTKTETQSIELTSTGKDNDVMYNWHRHDAKSLTLDNNEFSSGVVTTNGYYQTQTDNNNFVFSSEKHNLEECFGAHQRSGFSKALSNILQSSMGESSCRSPSSCKNNDTSPSVRKDTFRSELQCQQTMQAINMDSNLSEENCQTQTLDPADSLWSPAENLEQMTPDNTDSGYIDASYEQGYSTSYTPSPSDDDQEKPLKTTDQNILGTIQSNAQSFSRERIMSTIAETPELILPEYQSVFTSERKKPLMTKSCDNIYSGPSSQGSALKNKAQSMLCLLTEYYTTKLHSAENRPFEKVARGCFIRIPKGFQNIQEGVRFQLTLGNCLELLKLARKNSVPELLKEVYSLISDNYLHVLKNSAIYGQLTCLEREKILRLRMRGKLSLCIIETQSIFGLNKSISSSEDMNLEQPRVQLYSLDMESNQWNQITNIPEEACLKGCSICSMHNYLFIAGGVQNSKNGLLCSNKLFCYNPLTDIWTQLTPMNQARSQLKLVALDGYLYAIGGECLHTMERYDPRSNKWTFVAPLPKGSFAVAHEAAACGGEIYISGGHLFYRLLKYNPVRDLWEECPFNASRGRSCDMVAVGHILYRFDMHKDSSVHIFKYNTTAKVWSEYTTYFPNSKVPFRCAVLEGTIYCLNRETTARFAMEEEKVIFESAMFSKVPTKGIGYPCPIVLSLQGSLSQTCV
ncbi:uncharacterized protein [Dendropsophus ebraccatus]|uniref:uncharacterized protein n=1 Tax=Dendropsophus ebraccatus TaxID=150705 RepID=UPI00383167B7